MLWASTGKQAFHTNTNKGGLNRRGRLTGGRGGSGVPEERAGLSYILRLVSPSMQTIIVYLQLQATKSKGVVIPAILTLLTTPA